MGVNGLLIDYRGYGKSTGRINQEGRVYTDGLTAWTFLTTDKGIDPENIIIWGRSLGGGVAAEVAQFKKITAPVIIIQVWKTIIFHSSRPASCLIPLWIPNSC
jgi:fermentation-respiration switch protein FrsA (DUF1100 family)